MTFLLRQIWQLIQKNLIIAALRRPISTTIRAVIFPLALVLIVTYAQYFFNPSQTFGIGTASPIFSLSDALSRSSPSRNTVTLIFDDKASDEIKAVVDTVSDQVRKVRGRKVSTASDEGALEHLCRSSQRGSSNCYGAVILHSSPSFPVSQGVWNYTLRADESLGGSFNVGNQKNDAQIYLMPLQQAVDQAIITQTPSYRGKDLSMIQQYPFTEKTEQQREYDTRSSYLGAGISYFGVVFYLAMVGLAYQSTGLMAYERESGLSQLIDAMMPNTQRWQPAVIRMFSHHCAFSIIYFPSWLAIGIILAVKLFTFTSSGIIIIYHVLAGLALCSTSLFGGALFKKAQLSGIAVTVVMVVLAIVPQVLTDEKQTPATVITLSLLFPSSNYTYFLQFVSRWEYTGAAARLSASAPESPWGLYGVYLIVFLILQIVFYPLAAVLLERVLFGTTSSKRRLAKSGMTSATVRLTDFSKTYKPNVFGKILTKKRDPVHAVKNLTFSARQGQIYMLLGPNGSGKSTTLNAIAGLSKITGGQIEVDGSGGLGITPQKNTLWDDLTVEQHVTMFSNLKSAGSPAKKPELDALLEACDIQQKARAKTNTLSGGQKRKVQLALMFAGGSTVCCVDEVSSGLDPLSRRKVWDILLAQRSSRTIIMTTHFLDEADFLSDHIAILSKGSLKAEGSTAELKHRYGKGYTVETAGASRFAAVAGKNNTTRTFSATDAAHTAQLLAALEKDGISDHRVSGPTLEDVFLHLAGTSLVSVAAPPDGVNERNFQNGVIEKRGEVTVAVTEAEAVNLQDGRHINAAKQTWVLFMKRLMVFKWKWGPHLSALIVALIGAGVSPLFVKHFREMRCGVSDNHSPYGTPDSGYLTSLGTSGLRAVGGPSSQGYSDTLSEIAQLYPPKYSRYAKGIQPGLFERGLSNTSTLRDFNDFVATNTGSLGPGGFWLGDSTSPPVMAWAALLHEIYNPVILQNIMSNALSGIPIITSYSALNIPPEPQRYSFGALLFVIYFSLVFCMYPAFYALYPTVERLRQARALQYSNGVRSQPMWLAYLAFDSLHVVLISAISTGLLSLGTRYWFHLPFIFLILLLYGFASTILGYLISLFAKSQLSAWALCASGQVIMCLGYFGAYLGVSTNTDIADLNTTLLKVQNSIGFISPIANVQRSLYIALNQFLIDCGQEEFFGAPALYGGPIGYLIFQCLFFFSLLLFWDSGLTSRSLRGKNRMKQPHAEDNATTSHSQLMELRRTQDAHDGLRVMHLSKTFGHSKAVDNVTFRIGKSEIFALLGPNGAGKSTAISLIRGDIKPSNGLSDVHVDDLSLYIDRAKTRATLGVCPQFDATDVLSVYDHLKFYARVRGVVNPSHNVEELIRVFGLEPYRHQLASKLSGGTKRKLSLAIAMAGNPSVLLLDEPSSGLDAASKRIMWKTLSSISPDRSILLTTHSMEEADALADRAAIMSGRILALDTSDQLRRRWGDVYHVHLVMSSAPHTSPHEMERIKEWVRANLVGVKMDEKTYCGQLRFSVPARAASGGHEGSAMGVGQLFGILESNRQPLGIEYYAIGETTLDQVFVNVVREYGGAEEGSVEHVEGRKWWKLYKS